MKRVLVLGGGFAGVETAINLQKSKMFDVTLVSNRDYLYLYPISIWLPVQDIDEEDVKVSLEAIRQKHHFNLIIDKVEEIKASEQRVICQGQSLDYDYLVVAFGSDKLKLKGIEHTTTICGVPEQTLDLRDQLARLIAKGKGKIAIGFGGNPKDKSAVRGGPAFELMFNIDLYLRRKKLRDKFELTMFAPMPKPGIKMGEGAFNSMGEMFASKGIKKHFGKKIVEFTQDGIRFEDDTILESDLTMYISAGTGSAILQKSDLPTSESGFVKIDKYCQSVGYDNVYAVGDAAAFEGPQWVAKQGHIAEVMGRQTAYNIIQKEKGSDKRKSYQEHLAILCVMDTGNGAALVYRNSKTEKMIPLPIIGHWMKKMWGKYARWTKLKQFPKII